MNLYAILGGCILALVAFAGDVLAQPVVRYDGPDAPLAERWLQGQREAASRGWEAYWIGYSFDRWMGERSFIGHFSSKERERPTLRALLEGEGHAPETDLAETARQVLRDLDRKPTDDVKVRKEVALLFRFRAGKRMPEEVEVSNLSLAVDLDELPLFWLGHAAPGESLDFLKERYASEESPLLKAELVSAAGLHDPSPRGYTFLKSVATGNEGDKVREKAVFWLSGYETGEAVALLDQIARTDRSGDVRQRAVFALSRMEAEAATEALIALTEKSIPKAVRKKALFWLGQKASEAAVATLKQAAYDAGDPDVQKAAVFALTRLEDEQAVPLLIELAHTHPHPEIRKQAIFWLGQREDPRARDALIAIVRGAYIK